MYRPKTSDRGISNAGLNAYFGGNGGISINI